NVRLVDGPTANEGRVEVYSNGLWYPLCTSNFGQEEATIVCRQLGYIEDDPVFYRNEEFGRGSSDSSVDMQYSCLGNETSLSACVGYPSLSTSCTQVGVSCDSGERCVTGLHNCTQFCRNTTGSVACSCRNGYVLDFDNVTCIVSIRLVDGPNPYEGRVEIFWAGQWQPVCTYDFDQRDADVACRQLGYPTYYGTTLPSNQFGSVDRGAILMRGVHCTGVENSLFDCIQESPNQRFCNHSQDVALRDGAAVYYNATYGEGVASVYNESFQCVGNETALSDCPTTPSLQCPHSRDVGIKDGPLFYENGQFGRGNRYLSVDMQYSCLGNETTLSACVGYPSLSTSCTQVGVSCYTDDGCVKGLHNCTQFCRNTTGSVACGCLNGYVLDFDNVTCIDIDECAEDASRCDDICINTPGSYNCSCRSGYILNTTDWRSCEAVSVRLVSGTSQYNGVLQVYALGVWGTVCDDCWDDEDSDVACSWLFGSGATGRQVSSSEFPAQSGAILLDNVQCNGDEKTLFECGRNGVGVHDCQHVEDVALECTLPTRVRLVNGSGPAEGRVEYLTNGTWVTVCSDNFDAIDANVVCRELQSPGVTAIYNDTTFGAGNGSVYNESFQCVGNETALSDCPTTPSLQCPHSRDVGIKCQERVRLVNGGVANEGRLELFSGGDWYSVCDSGFDLEEAQVVCRELGFLTNGTLFYYNAAFGEGTGEVFGSRFDCVGDETNLFECGQWDVYCSHFDDVSLSCDTGVSVSPRVRLVNGTSQYNGVLQVYALGVWGTVCGYSWGDDDSNVACSWLFEPGSYGRYVSSYSFAAQRGAILLDDVACNGDEMSLFECGHRGLGSHNCQHGEDVALECTVSAIYANATFGAGIGSVFNESFQCVGNETALSDCPTTPSLQCPHSRDVGIKCQERVRLVNGGVANEGRLELFSGGDWYSVCDSGFYLAEAQVVCRELGFLTNGTLYYHNAEFGQGTGAVLGSRFDCSGHEMALSECSNYSVSCSHYDDVSLSCETGVSVSPRVRLVNGTSQYKGVLQVYALGVWGTVCDGSWGDADSNVACSWLFEPGSYGRYVPWYSFAAQRGAILLDDVACNGDEMSLFECGHRGLGSHNCQHREDVALECTVSAIYANATYGAGIGSVYNEFFQCVGNETALSDCPTTPSLQCPHSRDVGIKCQERVRLVNGGVANEGRLELFSGGDWYSVCNSGFFLAEAQVVCRELGFLTNGTLYYPNAEFGQGTGAVLGSRFDCSGHEMALSECRNYFVSCSHYADVSLSCETGVSVSPRVRLVNGTSPYEGVLQVYALGVWGTVCDDGWDTQDSDIACSWLFGFGAFGTFMSASRFPEQRGAILLDDVSCKGNEGNLFDCGHSGIGRHNCGHYEDVALECSLPGSQCGEAFEADSGSFASPGYPEVYTDSTDCVWTIKAPDSFSRILLTFHDINTTDWQCRTNNIQVIDSLDRSGELLASYCGTGTPDPLLSSADGFVVRLVSTADAVGNKFNASWKTVCETRLSDEEGTVQSPNFPTNYRANTDCTYVIEQRPGNVITLNFTSFRLGVSSGVDCQDDFVEIRDGSTEFSPLLGERYCGTTLPPLIRSTQNLMWIRFRSDNVTGNDEIGFSATYAGQCSSPNLTSSEGSFSSPGYPQPYPSYTYCQWTIRVEQNLRIELTFESMAIYGWGRSCYGHYVKMYDGDSADDESKLIETYCGSSAVPPVRSESSVMTVVFRSGFLSSYYYDRFNGFSASYTAFNPLELFPFGTDQGDTRLEPDNDQTQEVYIETGIPFSNTLQQFAYVSTNGLVSFETRHTWPYLAYYRKMVCAYSSYIDVTSSNGST
ncbi:hypothetical protein BaRGS_00019253, partial [Batillaria attramentaria]